MLRNAPLSTLTRFGTGGPADILATPGSTAELSLLLKNNAVEPITIIGAGSNILVPDDGLRGLVIHTGGLRGIRLDNGVLVAECGAPMIAIADFAAANGVPGFEFMIGIPGTIGGGLRANAGCFGGAISDNLISVRGFNYDGVEIEADAGQCGLTYRGSALPPDFIVSEVLLAADRTDDETSIRARMADIIAKKNAAQPMDARTAGSTFKNPLDAPAWKKIKDAFPNGLTVGGARISEKHANFIVADGACTSSDILELIKQIQEKTGLELEIKILGTI
ncbi:MAG: UDP-N-acetylmuramate dehydrogenase [Rickettsiales bacterium]|jgi:UDP-N-acetylmuramate dehydrogenase|nr:UDP-N-acetylmuramate dehydrogenase [Rickettsiales bacterium]